MEPKKCMVESIWGFFVLLIDENGIITQVVKKVKTKEHTEQLKKLLEL
jgi:peroxiredoxin